MRSLELKLEGKDNFNKEGDHNLCIMEWLRGLESRVWV